MFFSKFVCIYHFFPNKERGDANFFSNQRRHEKRLNFYVKAFSAPWAAHSMLSLRLWKAKLTATVRALAKDVRLAVSELIFAKLEPTTDFAKKAAKRLIFSLPFVNVSRKETKHRVKNDDQFQHGDDPMLDENVCDHERDRR